MDYPFRGLLLGSSMHVRVQGRTVRAVYVSYASGRERSACVVQTMYEARWPSEHPPPSWGTELGLSGWVKIFRQFTINKID